MRLLGSPPKHLSDARRVCIVGVKPLHCRLRLAYTGRAEDARTIRAPRGGPGPSVQPSAVVRPPGAARKPTSPDGRSQGRAQPLRATVRRPVHHAHRALAPAQDEVRPCSQVPLGRHGRLVRDPQVVQVGTALAHGPAGVRPRQPEAFGEQLHQRRRSSPDRDGGGPRPARPRASARRAGQLAARRTARRWPPGPRATSSAPCTSASPPRRAGAGPRGRAAARRRRSSSSTSSAADEGEQPQVGADVARRRC